MWRLSFVSVLTIASLGCAGGRVSIGPGTGPIFIGNDGFGSGELRALGSRLARETGVEVAIEPTPFSGPTAERLKQALRAGRPVFVAGYSAGCRDIVSALGEAGGKVRVYMIEPTYQKTHGYARLPDKVESLVCFRIKGGSALTFSGRPFEKKDFSNPATRFENIQLSTSSHLSACADPLVHDRLLADIKSAMEKERETGGYARAD